MTDGEMKGNSFLGGQPKRAGSGSKGGVVASQLSPLNSELLSWWWSGGTRDGNESGIQPVNNSVMAMVRAQSDSGDGNGNSTAVAMEQ